MFYRHNIKIIPRNLDKYLTPLALSTLFLSSPVLGQNSKLATICISAEDLEYLSLILKNKYNIETIIKFNNKSLNNLIILYTFIILNIALIKPNIFN